MDARNDPQFLQLYHDYARAIQAFENASRDRRRVRNLLAVKRSPVLQALQAWSRRPVGSPRDTHIPRGPAAASPRRPAAPPRPRRIYLGSLLGWATVVPTSTVVPELDRGASVDVDQLYDQTSLHLYWNAKAHYERCKRAFFDHVRRQNIDLHTQRVTDELGHGANMQLLGAETGDDPEFLEEARRELDAACRNAWALYQSSGAKKSTEMKVLLLESIADAQYVGLESPTVRSMTSEMDRLVSSGEIGR